jgi:hypothetical protein
MSTSHHRRTYGLTLAGLLVFQSLVMPLGVCGQRHEDGPAPTTIVAEHHDMDEDHAPVEHHGSAPQTCGAMSSCSVPALSAGTATTLSELDQPDTRAQGAILDVPIAVDLRIATPPPKITGS